MTGPRVSPLAADELDDGQRAYLRPFTDAKGRYPNIFGVLCRHMPLLEAWSGFGLYTMRGTLVDPLLREVLILRTARNCGSDYEWHQHRKIARSLGMGEADIESVRSDVPGFGDARDLMVACADDLAHGHKVSDATWAAMTAAHGLEHTLDAVFTVGAYTALAMALNSAGVEIEGRGPADGGPST